MVVRMLFALILYVIIFLDIVIVNFLDMQANFKLCNFIVGLKFMNASGFCQSIQDRVPLLRIES